MIVSDPRKALLLFEEHGTLVVESEVLMIEETINRDRSRALRTNWQVAT